jgi:hypothetical protein
MTRLRWVALAAFALLAVVLSISLLRGEARPVIVSDAPTLEPAPLTRSPELEPVEAPRAPPPTSLSEPLQAAVLAVAEGRLIEGRRMLDALRLAAEAGELSPEEQEAYQATRSALLEGRLSEVRDALTADLASANSARLERTLSSLNTEEERRLLAEQRGRGLLERARALLERLRAGDAQLADGSALDALETANRLLGEHPRLERAQVLKEQAAQAVQDRIEAAIEARRLAEARQLVSRLAALWPDRPGLAALRERVEQRIETRQQLESLLDQAQELAQRGRPHRGLELLETVGDVPPDVRSRLAQLRAGLLEMFRSADREPPTLTLLEEQRTFRKGEPIVLDLEAADDYEVQEVTLHVRTAGATAYTPLVAEARGAARYQAVIAPPLHGDKPVEIWLEATDRSGHKTLVGSAEQPVELRRKRWFRGN